MNVSSRAGSFLFDWQRISSLITVTSGTWHQASDFAVLSQVPQRHNGTLRELVVSDWSEVFRVSAQLNHTQTCTSVWISKRWLNGCSPASRLRRWGSSHRPRFNAQLKRKMLFSLHIQDYRTAIAAPNFSKCSNTAYPFAHQSYED